MERGYPDQMVNSQELRTWQEEYNISEIIENELELGKIEWEKCYSSDLIRAEKTAKKAFEGEIIYLEELREIPLSPFFKRNMKLPLFLHLIFIRMAWFFSHQSQVETRKDVLERINKVLDDILANNENILIVGHGGIMMFMSKELKKRGFKGPLIRRPKNGILYTFENC